MSRLRAKPNPTLREFAAYVNAWPSTLGAWRAGRRNLYPALGWLNTQPVVEQRERMAADGPVLGAMGTVRPHHNQVGLGVGWAVEHMTGPAREWPTREQDLVAVFEGARRHWFVRNLVAEVHIGIRRFEPEGTRIALRYDGNAKMDALDRLLDLVDQVTSVPESPAIADSRVGDWLRTVGYRTRWQDAPSWARDAFRGLATDVATTYPTYLSPDFDLGGLTMGDAVRVLTELLARANHAQAATLVGGTDPVASLPALEVDVLVGELSIATGVETARVEQVVDLLTVDLSRCDDVCLTPLVPFDEGVLVPMSSLIVPSSLERNFIALLQRDPGRFGSAGHELGRVGAQTVKATLERLTGALVTTSTDVRRADGSQAGDLDVVAHDPSDGSMAIFEVMWRIGVDGNEEVLRTEELADAKAEQTDRLRREVLSGSAVPQWPPGWGEPDVSAARWFVLTHDVLPLRTSAADGIIKRSHQMLERMLPSGSSVSELISLLDSPPTPPTLESKPAWERIRYGDYRVEFDRVAV